MAGLRQRKVMEVKGADHRLAKRVVQEVAEILETVRMAEKEEMAVKVEMVDWRQTNMMEAKASDHHLAKRAVLVHSKAPTTRAQPQESSLNIFQ